MYIINISILVVVFLLFAIMGYCLYRQYQIFKTYRQNNINLITQVKTEVYNTLNNLSMAMGKLNAKSNTTNNSIKTIVAEYNASLQKLDKKINDTIENVERITKECNVAINDIHQESIENKDMIKQLDLRSTDSDEQIYDIRKSQEEHIVTFNATVKQLNNIKDEIVYIKKNNDEIIKQNKKLLETIKPNRINKNDEDILQIIDKDNSVSDINTINDNPSTMAAKPNIKKPKYNFKTGIRAQQNSDVEKLMVKKHTKTTN